MAVALSRRLQRRGHRVRWTLLRAPGDLGETLEASLDPAFDLAPGRRPLAGIGALRRRLAGDEALYALDHQNAVVLAALASAGGRPPRRAVAVHTTGLFGGRASLGRAFRLALPRYTDVLALSDGHAAYLADREGVSRSRLRVVPNGIDPEGPRDPRERAEVREELGIASDAPVVGSVAMLRPEKNHRLLLEAAARLRGRHPGLRLLLVGDGPLRAELEARARREDLAGTVIFTGRRPDARRLLGAMDLFALPSLPAVETQPVSVLEAFDAGIPVVASRVGDLDAMLEGGDCGRLVPAEDLEALVEALEGLLSSPEARARLAARGRERSGSFTLDAAADALERVFEGSAS